MSKLYVAIASDRLKNYRTAQGDDFISASFTYGSAKDPKDAVKVELGADPFSASVWVNPELRHKDRGIRLAFEADDQETLLIAEIFRPDHALTLLAHEREPEEFAKFSEMIRKMADELGLYYDRTALDEWLEEDQDEPRNC